MANFKKKLKELTSQINYYHFALLSLISFISLGPVLKYYFSYEDLALFYSLQFPADRSSIFNGLDITGYHVLKVLFYPQFYLFNYQPLPYYIIAFLLFILMIFSLYLFVKVSTNNRYIALITGILTASGYIGIEAYTWTMLAGQLNSAFLIACFLTLTFTVFYIEKQRVSYLIMLVLFYCIGVYFFQFRSYLLIGWFLLLVLLIILKKGLNRTPGVIYISSFLMFILGILLFEQTLISYQGSINHLPVFTETFRDVYIRNVGQIIWPTQLIDVISKFFRVEHWQVEISGGLLSILLFIIVPIYCYFKRNQLFWMNLFFSLSFLSSLFLIMYVVSGIGIVPTVWLSTHRFYFILLPFLAGFLASGISLLSGKLGRNIQILFLVVWVLSHMTLSRQAIELRWENHSRHLKYFYQGFKQRVPVLDKDSAILVTQSEPRAPSPFVSGGYSDGFADLAGMYGLRLDDFNLSAFPEESLEIMRKKTIPVDKLYVFNYKKDDLADLTHEAREVLRSGSRKSLTPSFDKNIVNITNLDVLSVTPGFLDLIVKVTPDFLSIDAKTTSVEKSLEIPDEKLREHFALWVDENRGMKKMRTTSLQKPLSGEHKEANIIDGKYDTTWIPFEWEDKGVGVIVDLGEIRQFNQIVWSSSRTSTWYVRLPLKYEIQISLDGVNFTTIKKEDNAPVLKTGDFFIEDFPQQEARYLKLIINKTRGGLPPAIDEIEIFNDNEKSINFNEFFEIKKSPNAYFPDAYSAQIYLQEILENKIPLTIQWKVDDNDEYPAAQITKVLATPNISKHYIVPLPIIGRKVKAIRLQSIDFPAKLTINRIELWQPSLKEFTEEIEISK